MKIAFKKLILVLCVISITITVLYLFYIRFKNIDMTDTRLFVTYWKEGIVSFIILIGSSALFDATFKSL